MFACLRSPRTPPIRICLSLRTFSRTLPAKLDGLSGKEGDITASLDGESETLNKLAQMVREAKEGHDAAMLPATLQERPKPIQANTFSNPNHLKREHRVMGTARRIKDPTMGPGRKHAESLDVFRKLDIDSLSEYKNATLLKSFVSEMGKIKPRAKTGLTWRSQRRVGKAIRRARAMGIIPLWYQHQPSETHVAADWTRPPRSRYGYSD